MHVEENATAVRRANPPATAPERPRLSPWASAFNEALRQGVRKGRIQRDDAAILRGLVYHPLRRAKDGTEIDLLLLLEHEAGAMLVTDPAETPTIVWSTQVDWLTDRLPVLYKFVIPQMIQYPIPV